MDCIERPDVSGQKGAGGGEYTVIHAHEIDPYEHIASTPYRLSAEGQQGTCHLGP